MTSILVRWYPHALAGALCAGLAAANLAELSSAWTALVACAAAALAALAGPERRIPALALALLLAGWWWGSVRLDALEASTLRGHVGEGGRGLAVVTAPARRGPFAVRVPAEIRRFGLLALEEPVLLRLPPGRAPPRGALLELIGTLEEPRASDEGFDERSWLRRRGVSVVVDVSTWRVVGRRGGLGGFGDRLRSHLRETVLPGGTGERRAVVAGIVHGEDEGLSEELQDAFRASGLYHLLAVSGSNVAFLAAGVLVAAWLVGLPRMLGELAVLAAIGGYVLAVGWEPAVVRAGVAGGLASLAWLAARPRDRWYFLLVGAAVLLAWNPFSLLEPGFQLSFAAVAAIFVAIPRLERWSKGYPVPPILVQIAGVSAVCGIATAPIAWLHFGAVPAYSVPANALAWPVVAPILGLGLGAAAIHPIAPGLAEALGWANGWLAAYLAACARTVASLPGAQVTSGAVLGVLAALAAIVVGAARLDPLPRRRVLAATAAATALLVGWKAAPEPAAAPVAGMRITVLDVGQGDAILVQSGPAALLVDQGPPEADVAGQLARLGVRRLSLLVLTHPQRDHVGGAADVLARLDVDAVLDPAIPTDSHEQRLALAEARRRRVDVVVARAGAEYRIGALRVRVLWPGGPGLSGQDPNEHAVVLLVSYGDVDALLTADAESNVLLPLRPPPVEILKVAHHGSSDPLLPGLLRRVRPRVAVVSVGARNDYGHPTPSTLAALADTRLYRTDRDGRIVVETDGSAVVVRSDR